MTNPANSVFASIAIFAWNEEQTIGATLDSLFKQSFFNEIQQRSLRCEVLCVVNGCTDRTPEVVGAFFDSINLRFPRRAFDFLECRVVNLQERGKLNAWNQFVHIHSAKAAQFLFMMDADILIHRKETLWNMVNTLQSNAEASVSVDLPCKDILFKQRRGLTDRLSLAAAQVTAAAEAQLCAQLYCIRSEIARNIYLPRDLAACEDGFIKALVCTDFLQHEVKPERICLAPNAEHTFEAYTSLLAILKNQKRQIIGQTIVHILVDKHLKELIGPERQSMAAALSEMDHISPSWLKLLIQDHVAKTRFFWRIYPGLLLHRFKGLKGLPPMRRLMALPAVLAGSVLTLIASIMAYSSLKAGTTDYWPRAKRLGFGNLGESPALKWSQTNLK